MCLVLCLPIDSGHSTNVFTGGEANSSIREHEMQRILYFSSENQSLVIFMSQNV
jgi:hypothetical protein